MIADGEGREERGRRRRGTVYVGDGGGEEHWATTRTHGWRGKGTGMGGRERGGDGSWKGTRADAGAEGDGQRQGREGDGVGARVGVREDGWVGGWLAVGAGGGGWLVGWVSVSGRMRGRRTCKY